jgi:hypothetical protein
MGQKMSSRLRFWDELPRGRQSACMLGWNALVSAPACSLAARVCSRATIALCMLLHMTRLTNPSTHRFPQKKAPKTFSNVDHKSHACGPPFDPSVLPVQNPSTHIPFKTPKDTTRNDACASHHVRLPPMPRLFLHPAIDAPQQKTTAKVYVSFLPSSFRFRAATCVTPDGAAIV